jgi:hypothetical protein
MTSYRRSTHYRITPRPFLHSAALVLFAGATAASAAILSVNFQGNAGVAPGPTSMLASDVAGVVPATHFNNVSVGDSTTNFPLFDNNGSATTALLSYSSAGQIGYSNSGNTPADGNEKLNRGFVFGDSSFTISGIPYAQFDLYVYILNINGYPQQTTLGGLSYFSTSANPNDSSHIDGNAGTPYVYTRATGTTSGTATGTPIMCFSREGLAAVLPSR